MEELVLESYRRPAFLWVTTMQLMVDCFLMTIPFNSLADMYHAHLWTLPWMMLRVWVVSFFYDVLLQIAVVVEEPFGVDVDDLNLDAILVATERQVFFNLCQESNDMPMSLCQTWIAVKDMKEKDDEKNTKEKEDKTYEVKACSSQKAAADNDGE